MIDVGQTVGNYNITAKLGEGGMGMVFLAEHPVIGRKAALKAIHPHLARSVDTVSRFVNEAKAINQIQHQHIVDITDFGNTAAGDFYFIMEHLEGEMLSDAICHKGAFPPARALNIAAQIADALQASHEHGVIHRDLKPDNVFPSYHARHDARLRLKVPLDFGLAKSPHAPSAGHAGARRRRTTRARGSSWARRTTCPRSSARATGPWTTARTSTPSASSSSRC